ncbi:MAG: hypothetical protein M1814_001314 [Vezdaea aestivalis]|nr:MAG: hypothetical protein M1814_001314 [Vezdaea aestivalis]
MTSLTSPAQQPGTLAQRPQLAISKAMDDPDIRAKYRPFLLAPEVEATDWIAQLKLETAVAMNEEYISRTKSRLKVLVLYGSLRKRLMAYEASRILYRLGCDVRVFNPSELPIRDSVDTSHPSVQELRELSLWSDGHIWCSPEQHGNLTAVFKNQIDWIPLSTGSVRPTQGRTLAVIQVNGGSQSFNAVNSLRILGRWMRMFTVPNQSSLPTAWKQFEDEGGDGSGKSRLLLSGNRERLVDCMEEFVKFTIILKPHFELFGDRFSEREEKFEKQIRESAVKEDTVNQI